MTGDGLFKAAIADWRCPKKVAICDVGYLLEAHENVLQGWKELGFHGMPEKQALLDEAKQFLAHLRNFGIHVELLKNSSNLSLDCLYARDSLALTPGGLIECRMQKPARVLESAAFGEDIRTAGYRVYDSIKSPGTLEGGDIVWLSDDICAVGITYRTNIDGIEQFKKFLPPYVRCVPVHVPHYCGPSVIFHLSSILSVISQQVVLADVRYLPVSFLFFLSEQAFKIIVLPEDDRHTLGVNVLSLGNNTLLSFSGNARTQALLTAEGFHVISTKGDHLGILGDGGPTCLTRPLAFESDIAT